MSENSSELCYIGDPCYVFTHVQWREIKESIHPVSGKADYTKAKLGDHFLFIRPTRHGDGVFPIKELPESELGVDSGSLSCIPVKLIRDTMPQIALKLGVIVDVDINKCTETNGLFQFDKYTVST